jgi:regulator of RNase E activity RraB
MHELESIQLAENKRMCHALADAGDKSDTVHMIVHKLEFISEYKRRDLLDELEAKGFEVVEEFVTEEGYNGLLFQRENNTTHQEIDNMTRKLLVLLDEHDARYGGWTTEVMQ